MTSSDGLQRLTEYLAQTRRQANAAIDILNTKVEELELRNSELRQREKSLQAERDDFQSQLKLLRAENSTKYQLRERDDWKAVLDSVQKDRKRLSDECKALKRQLDNLQYENQRLQREVEIHSGKLILGITGNDEALKKNEEKGGTKKNFSSCVIEGSKNWAQTLEEVSRLKVSRAVLLNGASGIKSVEKNTVGGAMWNLWNMIFGREQIHPREDTNNGILIV